MHGTDDVTRPETAIVRLCKGTDESHWSSYPFTNELL